MYLMYFFSADYTAQGCSQGGRGPNIPKIKTICEKTGSHYLESSDPFREISNYAPFTAFSMNFELGQDFRLIILS